MRIKARMIQTHLGQEIWGHHNKIHVRQIWPDKKGLAKEQFRPTVEYPIRQMIIATNAAETAATFENCWAVVPPFHVQHRSVSKDSIQTKGGRAGRMLPGLCVRMVTQTEWNNMPETEPPQPELEDMTPIYLRLVRFANTEARNRILDELNIPEQLRAMVIEQLFFNEMISLDGELTGLGKFVSDFEPGEPEYGSILWYGHQHHVFAETLTIYVALSRGSGFVSQKARAAYPHADGDLHTILHVWNIATWLYEQTKTWDPNDKDQNDCLTNVWGKYQLSLARICKDLLQIGPERVRQNPMTDKAATSWLSLVLFKAFKISLMVRDVTGYYTSISDMEEWRLANSSNLVFRPFLIITPGRTARILGANSKQDFAPEKVIDMAMPVPEEFLLTQMWYVKNMGKNPYLQGHLGKHPCDTNLYKHGHG